MGQQPPSAFTPSSPCADDYEQPVWASDPKLCALMLMVSKVPPLEVLGTIQTDSYHTMPHYHAQFVPQPPARLGQGCVPALVRDLLVLWA